MLLLLLILLLLLLLILLLLLLLILLLLLLLLQMQLLLRLVLLWLLLLLLLLQLLMLLRLLQLWLLLLLLRVWMFINTARWTGTVIVGRLILWSSMKYRVSSSPIQVLVYTCIVLVHSRGQGSVPGQVNQVLEISGLRHGLCVWRRIVVVLCRSNVCIRRWSIHSLTCSSMNSLI